MQVNDNNRQGFVLNEDTIKGKWTEFKGGVQKNVGRAYRGRSRKSKR